MTTPAAALLTPEQVAIRAGSNFVPAFALVAPERKRALTALYAFCRVIDDCADEGPSGDPAALEFWQGELAAAYAGKPATLIGKGLQSAAERFGVRRDDLQLVVEGVRSDLVGTKFDTMAELDQYCRQVASAVGWACLPVFGASSRARDYAEQLGLALQLTNILRDLREDAARGRVYVPSQILAQHGVDPQWLLGTHEAGTYAAGAALDRMVQSLVGVANDRFVVTRSLLPIEDAKFLVAPEIMAAVYRELLTRIARRGGDVRQPRTRVPKWKKLLLAWQTRRRMRR